MRSLKIIFIVALFIVNIECRPLTMKQRNKIYEDCIALTKIDRALVKKALALNIPHDPKYKEYLFCSYKGQGYQTESGEIVHEEIKSFLNSFYSKTDTTFIVDTCKGISFEDPKETTFATMMCILKNIFQVEKKSFPTQSQE